MKNSSTIENDIITYEFITKNKKVVSISIEDSLENPKFKIVGPKEIINKAIGGIGVENADNTETTVTEVDLKTEAKRMFAVLEIIKIITE